MQGTHPSVSNIADQPTRIDTKSSSHDQERHTVADNSTASEKQLVISTPSSAHHTTNQTKNEKKSASTSVVTKSQPQAPPSTTHDTSFSQMEASSRSTEPTTSSLSPPKQTRPPKVDILAKAALKDVVAFQNSKTPISQSPQNTQFTRLVSIKKISPSKLTIHSLKQFCIRFEIPLQNPDVKPQPVRNKHTLCQSIAQHIMEEQRKLQPTRISRRQRGEPPVVVPPEPKSNKRKSQAPNIVPPQFYPKCRRKTHLKIISQIGTYWESSEAKKMFGSETPQQHLQHCITILQSMIQNPDTTLKEHVEHATSPQGQFSSKQFLLIYQKCLYLSTLYKICLEHMPNYNFGKCLNLAIEKLAFVGITSITAKSTLGKLHQKFRLDQSFRHPNKRFYSEKEKKVDSSGKPE